MRVAVLGGSGFVGAAIVRAAQRLRFETVSLEKPAAADSPARAAETAAAITSCEPQIIVHAADTRNGEDEIHLLSRLARLAIRTIIIGSAAVLAGSPPDIEGRHSEKAAPRPIGAYGEFKLWQESEVLGLRAKGWIASVARLFNPIGPGMGVHLMLGRLVREIVQREQTREAPSLIEMGPLSAVRDFMHVDDAAEGVLAVSLLEEAPALIHVACGKGHSARQIARMALAMSTRQDLEIDETREAASQSAAADRVIGDSSLLRHLTGWKPERSIEFAVAEALSAERTRNSAVRLAI